MHISTWENHLRYGIIYSTAWSSLHLQMQDKLGLAGTLESASEGNVEREELKVHMASFQERIPEAAKIFFTSCKCMCKCRSAANNRVQKDEEADPQLPAMFWRKILGILLGLHFGSVNSSITPKSTACQDQFCNCLAIQSMSFFSEGVDLTAPKLIAHFAAYRRPQMYSSMFKFLPSFPVYCIETTIKWLTCICI